MVLNKTKTQTSRIWQPGYLLSWNSNPSVAEIATYSALFKLDGIRSRKLHYLDQVLSVQPARGAKGVAKIRVTELAKRDVRDFATEDIRREGFATTKAGFIEFYRVWYGMHFPAYVRLLDEKRVTPEWWLEAMSAQIDTHNLALVIRFELVTEAVTA
jgi:hypothetical protein